MIRDHPLALRAIDTSGRTPLQCATNWNRPAAMTSHLTDATNALATGDFPALAALVHGNVQTLRCTALSPERLAVRVTLLLCIKSGYVFISRSKHQRQHTETVALDIALAFDRLSDNVWSHIMTFL